MSTLAVNTITNAAGGNTATINGMTPTADSLQGFRNRIINGDMRIDQRNAAVTSTAYTVDRWQYQSAQSSKGTAQKSTTAPENFISSLQFTSSSAYSVLTGDYFALQQVVEGVNISDFSWGTANAKPVTLSFKVYSSLTGTFGGSLINGGNNRSYPFSYTVSTANTWTTISVPILGDTAGTWATDTSAGIKVWFSLGAGATYSGTAGAWSGSLIMQPTGSVSVVGTSGATFYITGVQLEAGSVASPFERRPYGTELQLAQRYCYVWGGVTQYQLLPLGCSDTGNRGEGLLILPATMRTSPTVTFSSTASNFRCLVNGGSSYACTSMEAGNQSIESVRIMGYVSSGISAGNVTQIGANNSLSPRIYVSAEL